MKKHLYFKCKKCGTEIEGNTHKRYTPCNCGAIAIDSCEDYIRMIGDKQNILELYRDEKDIIKNSPF